MAVTRASQRQLLRCTRLHATQPGTWEWERLEPCTVYARQRVGQNVVAVHQLHQGLWPELLRLGEW